MNGELEWMKVKIESTQNPLTLWFSARSQQVFHWVAESVIQNPESAAITHQFVRFVE